MKPPIRFSLRSLVLGVTALCFALGIPTYCIRLTSGRQRSALHTLNSLKVEGRFADELPPAWWKQQVRTWIDRDAFRKVTGISITEEAADWDAIAELLPRLNGLHYVHNRSSQLNDRHLSHLVHVPTLRQIILSDGNYTAKGLQPLLDRVEFVRLQTPKAEFDDEQLARLGAMKSLRFLSFNASQATCVGVSHLENCRVLGGLQVNHLRDVAKSLERLQSTKTLIHLEIADSILSQDDLNRIGDIVQLEVLVLPRCHLGGSLEPIARLQGLRILDLEGTAAPHRDLASIQRLPKLSSLTLHGVVDDGNVEAQLALMPLSLLSFSSTELSDDGLQKLAHCRALRRLILPGDTRCTPSGIRRLQEKAAITVYVDGDSESFTYPPGGAVETKQRIHKPLPGRAAAR